MNRHNAIYPPHYYARDSRTGLAVPSVRSIRDVLCHGFMSPYVHDPKRSTWGIHDKYAIRVKLIDQEKWDTLEWYNYEYDDITTPLVEVTAICELAPLSDDGEPEWKSPLMESFIVSFYDNGEDMVYASFLTEARAFDHVKPLIELLLNLFEVERVTEYYAPSLSDIEVDDRSVSNAPSLVQLTVPFYCKARTAYELDAIAQDRLLREDADDRMEYEDE